MPPRGLARVQIFPAFACGLVSDLQIVCELCKMSDLPRIDHIIIGAKNLKAAGDHVYDTYGLASYVGGRHQGWGTENIIVPLGEAYLEIAAVFDEKIANEIDWGR